MQTKVSWAPAPRNRGSGAREEDCKSPGERQKRVYPGSGRRYLPRFRARALLFCDPNAELFIEHLLTTSSQGGRLSGVAGSSAGAAFSSAVKSGAIEAQGCRGALEACRDLAETTFHPMSHPLA